MVISMMACGAAHPAHPMAAASALPAPAKLAVLPVSEAFPDAARAVSASLVTAKVDGTDGTDGLDETRLSQVSLEVVQLSRECIDPTGACYEEVGRSMPANQRLSAQIAGSAARRQIKITVTLFDGDARTAKRTVEKVFDTEDEATAGVAALVAAVTQ